MRCLLKRIVYFYGLVTIDLHINQIIYHFHLCSIERKKKRMLQVWNDMINDDRIFILG